MKLKFKNTCAAALSLFTITTSFAAKNAPAVKMPNDAQIAKIVETVNEGEIKLAHKAMSISKNEEVKNFAEHMITDHKMNNEKAIALTSKYHMTPADSEKSLALKKDGEKSMVTLLALKGAEFDKAYVANQLKAHKMVLDDLNGKLIPAAKNAELKAYLELTAKKVEGHIHHAESLQSSL